MAFFGEPLIVVQVQPKALAARDAGRRYVLGVEPASDGLRRHAAVV